MIGLVLLAWRHLTFRWGRSAILAGCAGVAMAVPLIGGQLTARFEQSLRARAATVPLIVGAKGSRFDLVFAALYFRKADLGPVPYAAYEALRDDPEATALPVHAAFTARGQPIVATSFEYFERRGLAPATGRQIARIGEAIAGAAAARRLGLGAGGTVVSDQRGVYDITAPPSIRLEIVGTLAPTGTPDDDAIFTDLETAWVLEGIAHGHDDAETITRDDLVIGRSGDRVVLSEAVVTVQEITDANASSFHVHGPRDALPLTAVLVYPSSEKAATILATRTNASEARQAVVPSRVVDDLMAFVFRIRTLFDGLALVLGLSTAALLGLIATLSYRVRADEVRMLGEIGCSRAGVLALFGAELAIIAVLAAGLALILAGVALAIAPGLMALA